MVEDGPWIASSSSHRSSSFPSLGWTWYWSVGFLSYQSLSTLLHSVVIITLRALGLNAFNHPLKFQLSYVFPPPALILLAVSKFLVEHVTSKFRLTILVVPCWREAPWLLTVFNMFEDVPHQCPIIKGSHYRCFCRSGAQGPVIAAFNPLDMCCTDKVSLPESFRWQQGKLKHLQQSLPVVLERMGWLVCSRRCTRHCHFCLLISWFFS